MELFFIQQFLNNKKLYDFQFRSMKFSFSVLWKIQDTSDFTVSLGSFLYALHMKQVLLKCLH